MKTMRLFLYFLLCFSATVLNVKAAAMGNGKGAGYSGGKGGQIEIDLNCTCGISEVYDKSYNEGSTVDLKKYPWLVSIYQPSAPNPWGSCGGALIAQDLILTAAACVEKNDIKVRLLSSLKWKQDRNIGVHAIIPHPNYHNKNKNFNNDIALIKLERPVQCTKYSRPICVATSHLAKINSQIMTAGWENSYYLQEGAVTVIDKGPCEKLKMWDKNRLCTKDDVKTICHGGVGTAGFIKNNGKYYAVGVAVGDPNHCDKSEPTVYTRVSHYTKFINQHMKKPENKGK